MGWLFVELQTGHSSPATSMSDPSRNWLSQQVESKCMGPRRSHHGRTRWKQKFDERKNSYDKIKVCSYVVPLTKTKTSKIFLCFCLYFERISVSVVHLFIYLCLTFCICRRSNCRLTLFSILWSHHLICICSLSSSLSLWSINLSFRLFSVCLLSLLAADWPYSSDCPLLDTLHL